MDLSEVEKFEAKPAEVTHLVVPELSSDTVVSMVNNSFTAVDFKAIQEALANMTTAFTVTVRPIPTPLITREHKFLLLKFADVLESERSDVRYEQTQGAVSRGGYLLHFPVLSPLTGPGEIMPPTATVPIAARQVYVVCAIGKIVMELWGSFDKQGNIPVEIREQIIYLNDKRGLSFLQIAAALREMAHQL